MASFEEKMLAQVRVSTTDATLLYRPAKNMIVHATYMVINNRGAAVADLTWYHDNNGNSRAAATMLMNAVPFAANEFNDWSGKIVLNTLGGNTSSLWVVADTADAFTLTLYGAEIK
jgi:hypothetical protein